MSKGNLFLGFGRGKVGDVVFYRSNGEQITRSLNRNPKNPRSESQLLQRIIMGTVMQAYSKMKSITDHSFEGVQPGASTMAEFLRLNVDNLRARVASEIESGSGLEDIYAFTPMSTSQFAPNEYIVSRGTLPQVPCVIEATTAAVQSITENTYQAVIDAYGLQRGDQLTFLWSQGTTPARTEFYFCRVILDPRNLDGSEAPLTSAFVGANNLVNLPNPRNEGQFGTLTYSDSAIHFGFNQQAITSAGVIVSRKVNGSWLRSSCTLGWSAVNVAMSWPSIGECIALVNEGDITTVGQRYLNNAGKGKTAVSKNVYVTEARDGIANLTLVGVGVKNAQYSYEEGGQTLHGTRDYIVLIDSNGNQYYLKAGPNLQWYDFALYNMTAYASDAWKELPDDATAANSLILFSNYGDFVTWLQSMGMSLSVFMSEQD